VRRTTIGRIAAAVTAVAVTQSLAGCVVAAGSRSDGTGSSSFVFLLLPLALLALFAGMGRRRRGRRSRSWVDTGSRYEQDEEVANAHVLRAELSVLADDVVRLEPLVALEEAARDDYEAATHRYRVAQAALEQVEERVDLVRVQRVVDEANWSMARARAILDGRPPPAPPPPLQRPGPHGEPAVRVDERQRPVYVDSSAPFRSGWSSAGGGLFGGLLLGSMLGGFGGGWIVHDDGDPVDDGEGAGDGDGDPGDW
jgi:hypothetical protein